MIRASRRPAKAKYSRASDRPRFTGTYHQIQADHREAQGEVAVARLKERVLGDIDGAMVQVIKASMVARGAVCAADFVRSGIPPQEIELRFRRCMNRAREEAPDICGVMVNA